MSGQDCAGRLQPGVGKLTSGLQSAPVCNFVNKVLLELYNHTHLFTQLLLCYNVRAECLGQGMCDPQSLTFIIWPFTEMVY